MHAALRLLSFILIAAGLILLGADFITSLEKGGGWTVRSVAQIWSLMSQGSETAFYAWLQHSLPGPVAGWIGTFLSVPAWLLTGVIGVILAFVFGRRASERA